MNLFIYVYLNKNSNQIPIFMSSILTIDLPNLRFVFTVQILSMKLVSRLSHKVINYMLLCVKISDRIWTVNTNLRFSKFIVNFLSFLVTDLSLSSICRCFR